MSNSNRKFGWIALLVGLYLLVTFALVRSSGGRGGGDWEFPASWYWHDTDAQRLAHAELLGKSMPWLELSDWRNGEITSDDLKGKVVVLDFWATWCGPCLAAVPQTNALYAKYHRQGLEVIAVCTSTGQESYGQVVQTHQMQYPTARDPSGQVAQAWRVMWYPTYAVVDRKGIVRAVGLGGERLEAVVGMLLDEPAG